MQMYWLQSDGCIYQTRVQEKYQSSSPAPSMSISDSPLGEFTSPTFRCNPHYQSERSTWSVVGLVMGQWWGTAGHSPNRFNFHNQGFSGGSETSLTDFWWTLPSSWRVTTRPIRSSCSFFIRASRTTLQRELKRGWLTIAPPTVTAHRTLLACEFARLKAHLFINVVITRVILFCRVYFFFFLLLL